jgi:hypothetical protein
MFRVLSSHLADCRSEPVEDTGVERGLLLLVLSYSLARSHLASTHRIATTCSVGAVVSWCPWLTRAFLNVASD